MAKAKSRKAPSRGPVRGKASASPSQARKGGSSPPPGADVRERIRAAAERAVKKRHRPRPRKGALDGLELIRDELARSLDQRVVLKMTTPDRGRGRTPWGVMARLSGFRTDYESLRKALEKIEESGSVSRQVGDRTYARIAVTYDGPRKRGRKGETRRDWTIGEIAPWEVTTSRATHAVGDARERYKSSRAVALLVWLSTDEAHDVEIEEE